MVKRRSLLNGYMGYGSNKNLQLVEVEDIQREVQDQAYLQSRTSSLKKHSAKRGSYGQIPMQDLWLKMEMQNWQCMYCKDKVTFYTCCFDHVHPVAKGGETYLYKIAITCCICNAVKGKRTLERFCKKLRLDYEQISQEFADINKRLHAVVDWNDGANQESALDDYQHTARSLTPTSNRGKKPKKGKGKKPTNKPGSDKEGFKLLSKASLTVLMLIATGIRKTGPSTSDGYVALTSANCLIRRGYALGMEVIDEKHFKVGITPRGLDLLDEYWQR